MLFISLQNSYSLVLTRLRVGRDSHSLQSIIQIMECGRAFMFGGAVHLREKTHTHTVKKTATYSARAPPMYAHRAPAQRRSLTFVLYPVTIYQQKQQTTLTTHTHNALTHQSRHCNLDWSLPSRKWHHWNLFFGRCFFFVILISVGPKNRIRIMEIIENTVRF